jgi:SAM-dependent methyltransferase
VNYSELRRPDPRIAAAIEAALGDARTILNVGAGTGSYEPEGRDITAVEPSAEMNRQRKASSARVVQASAEKLPFDDASFDASMAVLTVHHWADKAQGLREMRRVTRGPIIILTFDPNVKWFWLADYFPELIAIDNEKMPKLDAFQRLLGDVDISVVPVPHDCTDGFLACYWRRPEAYLDQRVRNAISSFHKIDDATDGLARLADDLQTGNWHKRYGHLADLGELDCGYRLVVAR